MGTRFFFRINTDSPAIVYGFLLPVIAFVFFLFPVNHSSAQKSPQTYCNPMNINYGPSVRGRHAADPVIVLFKDKYYLFTTWDIKGYRVSDDLFMWKDILFNDTTWQKLNCNGTITAPAVATDGNYLYFINFNSGNRKDPVTIFRTQTPETGNWHPCGSMRVVADPCLFIDEGRFFVYHGLGANQGTKCFELDPETLTEIPGSEKVLRPALKGISDYEGGYHRGRRELFGQTDASEWLDKFSMEPCPEAAWMTRHGNTYYLQYATPGTVSQWYSDIVMTGDTPQGPFTECDYNPVSMKAGGFIGSAGHSSVFADKNGRLWRVTTMWIGRHNLFERRLGLFPVTFDQKGRMITHTLLGDFPMFRDYETIGNQLKMPGWMMLSFQKKCMASSSVDTLQPYLASDENIRTWWSAKTGNPGEWLSIDLGKMAQVSAIQVNFAEQEAKLTNPDTSDYHAWKILHSSDGKNWELLIDKSRNKSCAPHDYIELEKPLTTRYLKIVNAHTALYGKFAISDFRIFGDNHEKLPQKVKIISNERLQTDDRSARISWSKSKGADGYLVRFGVDPSFLNQCIQVNDNEKTNLGIHVLIKNKPYFFRVDAWNGSGITTGK